MLEATQNCRDFTVSDIADAGADFFAQAMGAKVRNPHPVSDQLKNRELSLAEAAHILGEKKIAERRGNVTNPSGVISAGLTTDDFGSILEAATARLVTQSYLEAAQHRSLVYPYPVPNYQPAEIATLDVDADTGELDELEEIPPINVEVGGGNVGELESYAANLIVSYKLVVNNNLDALTTTARAIAVSAARREARRLYEFIESNPNLKDGNPMFSAGAGNVVASAGTVTADSLGKAMSALREQQTPGGQYANHRLQTVVVPATQEQAALQVIRETGIQGVELVASPWIEATTWYAMASPGVAPTVAMLYLGPSGDTEMRTVRVYRRPADSINRRTGIEVAHDFGFAPVSRVGIVKLTG